VAGRKRGAPQAAPLPFLLGNGVDGAAVFTGPALGTIVGNGVFVAGFGNGPEGTGIDTGAASDAFVGNFESHEFLLVLVADGAKNL